MMIGLDANCVIYLIEKSPHWGPKVVARLAVARAAGDQLAVSDLSRAECLVGPFKSGDSTGLADFQRFFSSPTIRMLPIDPAVCEEAARLRARHNFKLPDAVNLAAAILHGCGLYLTNDAKLTRCTGIAVEVLA